MPRFAKLFSIGRTSAGRTSADDLQDAILRGANLFGTTFAYIKLERTSFYYSPPKQTSITKLSTGLNEMQKNLG